MNDPIPPELEELMKDERAAQEPLASQERVRRRLEGSVRALAVGAATGAALGGLGIAVGAKGEAILRGMSFVARKKLATIALATTTGAAGVAGGGVLAYHAGERAERARHAAPAEAAPPARPSAIPSAPEAPPDPSQTSAPPPAPASAVTPPVVSSARLAASTSPTASQRPVDRDAALVEELALVQTARTALVRGDAAGALDATKQHRRRFPSGRLVEERESLAIQALARLGRDDEARQRAADFERTYPSSLFRPAIARALGK